MARTLFETTKGGILFVLGDESLPVYQREGDVEIIRCNPTAENLLERSLQFSRQLARLVAGQRDSLEICHFRDPWSGVPVLENRAPGCVAVYEINGLPSIELPYRYPNVAPETLRKIRAAEQFCWSEADAIITPSRTMRENLIALGVTPEKISVVPNGAEPKDKPPTPADAPQRYVMYFGALQRWQGVDNLLRAMSRLADLDDLWLVVCSSTHQRQSKVLRKLAEKLGVADRTLWFFGLDEEELAPWRANALLTVAPLTDCSRNIEQGCCPLKILESMAAGVPVVATDLPSVREIVTNRVDGWLVRPDRPSELAMAIRLMIEYPDRLRNMGEAARRRIEECFTWEESLARLSATYVELLAGRGANSAVDSFATPAGCIPMRGEAQ